MLGRTEAIVALLGYRVYLAYLDDSECPGKYQIVAAIIVDSLEFDHLEDVFAFIRELELQLPEDEQATFEFHASDLYNEKYKGIDREKAIKTIHWCAKHLATHGYPIFFGAVDLKKHKSGLYSDAKPITVGLQVCLDGVNEWMTKYAGGDMSLAVFDYLKDQGLRQALLRVFRNNRKRLNTMEGSKGKWPKLVDDLYFGDSATSVGIQAADLCAFLINRHLNEREDTELSFKLLEPHIHFRKIVPD